MNKIKLLLIAVVIVVAGGFLFYFLSNNSRRSKASFVACVPNAVCTGEGQCGDNGKCIFETSMPFGPTVSRLGKCSCGPVAITPIATTPAVFQSCSSCLPGKQCTTEKECLGGICNGGACYCKSVGCTDVKTPLITEIPRPTSWVTPIQMTVFPLKPTPTPFPNPTVIFPTGVMVTVVKPSITPQVGSPGYNTITYQCVNIQGYVSTKQTISTIGCTTPALLNAQAKQACNTSSELVSGMAVSAYCARGTCPETFFYSGSCTILTR